MDASKVIPALIFEYKRNPEYHDRVLHSLLEIAETHHDAQIPATILTTYRGSYSRPLSRFALENLMQNGDRTHGPMLARQTLNRMSKIASPKQFWVNRIVTSGCLAMCVTPALFVAAPIIYFQHKKWQQDIQYYNELATQVGDQLVRWEAVESLGVLALWAKNPQFEMSAIFPIDKLLDRLNGENEIVLPVEQVEAMNRLLFSGDYHFRSKLVRTSPYWGDLSTLKTLQKIIGTSGTPEMVLSEAVATLPLLERRIARLQDVKTLMRPASEQADTSTLMRPAPTHPGIPPEQLLRKPEP